MIAIRSGCHNSAHSTNCIRTSPCGLILAFRYLNPSTAVFVSCDKQGVFCSSIWLLRVPKRHSCDRTRGGSSHHQR